MRRMFIEYLGGSDCFHFCGIPVELSARRIQNEGQRSPPQMRNARITSYIAGVLVVYWKVIAMSVSRKVHNTNSTLIILVSNTWPFFHNREKNGEL
jgi:hypothetical protein